MKKFEKILVVADPRADKQPALARATWLAEKSSARVELFVCDHDQSLSGDQTQIDRRLAHHCEWLDDLAQPLRDRGIETSVDARWDRPLDEGIVRKVIAASPDIVLKDTHHHSILKRTLFSNTDWSLIRSCPAALLLVKDNPVSPAPRVLAGVDPLHEHDKPAALDREILRYAQSLANLSSGELHVAHVFDAAPLAYAGSAGMGVTVPLAVQPSADVIDALMSSHRAALDELLEEYDLPASRIRFERGAAPEALPNIATEIGASFAVLGAISRSGLKRVFLGNTAEQVLDRMPCDLLVIKPTTFQSDVASVTA